jgi:hypothetical protein
MIGNAIGTAMLRAELLSAQRLERFCSGVA